MPHYRLFYHFVWTTKERQPLITTANQSTIDAAIQTKTLELKGLVHALNSRSDHIHLVATVPPSLSLSEFVRQIKGNSSHLVGLATRLQDTFAWQQDYGVYTISESHLSTVVSYVENQQKHHNEQTLDSRLEP